jgi:hypothetical protein
MRRVLQSVPRKSAFVVASELKDPEVQLKMVQMMMSKMTSVEGGFDAEKHLVDHAGEVRNDTHSDEVV